MFPAVMKALSVLDVTVACDVVASTPEILSPSNTSWIRALFAHRETALMCKKVKAAVLHPAKAAAERAERTRSGLDRLVSD